MRAWLFVWCGYLYTINKGQMWIVLPFCKVGILRMRQTSDKSESWRFWGPICFWVHHFVYHHGHHPTNHPVIILNCDLQASLGVSFLGFVPSIAHHQLSPYTILASSCSSSDGLESSYRHSVIFFIQGCRTQYKNYDICIQRKSTLWKLSWYLHQETHTYSKTMICACRHAG